jgi:hypothetical protein
MYKKAIDSYISEREDELELLKSFNIPKVKAWKIDWTSCDQIAMIKPRNWKSISIFSDLLKNKMSPAVYYFTVSKESAEALYQAFLTVKSQGLQSKRFLSVSHVPKTFQKSSCIYAGSRVEGLDGRLKQHLGYGSGSRTGGLYLKQVLSNMSHKPEITFNYFLLDGKYKRVTKHIECIIQDQLKPFIGKRAL